MTPEAGQEAEPVVWTIDIYDIDAPADMSTPEALRDAQGSDRSPAMPTG